jgi:hypothetical protein
MRSTSAICFTFLYFQNAFSSVKNGEKVGVEGPMKDCSGTSGVPPGRNEVGTNPATDDKAPVPSTSKGSIICSRCEQYEGLTRKMEKFSHDRNLEKDTRENVASGFNRTFEDKNKRKVGHYLSRKGRGLLRRCTTGAGKRKVKKAPLDEALGGILSMVSGWFEHASTSKDKETLESAHGDKSTTSMKLSVILRIMRDVMKEICEADPCKRGSSGVCSRYKY